MKVKVHVEIVTFVCCCVQIAVLSTKENPAKSMSSTSASVIWDGRYLFTCSTNHFANRLKLWPWVMMILKLVKFCFCFGSLRVFPPASYCFKENSDPCFLIIICASDKFVFFHSCSLQDWVLAPTGYSAYYCHGECIYPLGSCMNATNHALIQLVVSTNQKPHCAVKRKVV